MRDGTKVYSSFIFIQLPIKTKSRGGGRRAFAGNFRQENVLHNFTWNADALARAEWIFLTEAGMSMGAARHLSPDRQSAVVIDLLTRGAAAAAELQGTAADYGCTEAAVRRRLGLSLTGGGTGTAADSAAALTVETVLCASAAVTRDKLGEWASLLCQPAEESAGTEIARTGSAAQTRRAIRHAAAHDEDGSRELDALLRWFDDRDGDAAVSPLFRAGTVHLWFERLHPLGSATGRAGRALAEIAVMRGLPVPVYTPLAPALLGCRHEYYHMLDSSCCKKDITDWLLWFSALVIEAGRRSRAVIDFAVRRQQRLEELRDAVSSRQEAALRHIYELPPDRLVSGLTLDQYRAAAGGDTAEADADAERLVRLGALSRVRAGGVSRLVPAVLPETVERVSAGDLI